MSMSTSVKGFRPPDEEWKKMKAIWDACKAAGNVEPPEPVQEFFNWHEPDPNGIDVHLRVTKWNNNECSEGLELKVEDIPKNVTVIRFYNSW